MILLDANLLIYAYDETSPHHEPARRWLEDAFAESDEVAIPLVGMLAFLRVMTDPRLFDAPMPVAEATRIVAGWLALPNVGIAQPTRRHVELIADLARTGKVRGPSLMDAHVAALALEHGATLVSSDRGFVRFPGVSVEDPVAS